MIQGDVTVGTRLRAVLDQMAAELRDPPAPREPVLLPQSIDDVRRWREDLAGLGELQFVELARLLRDRPQPPKAAIDADTVAAKEQSTGRAARAPEWARALLDSLISRQRLISHLQASMAADFAALAGGYPGLREHLATEIALALGCSEGSADRQLDAAEELGQRLPATQAAHYRGRLTGWKVTAIASETKDVPEEIAAQVEADVLPAAPRQTVPELRQAIRRAILVRDPDGSELRHRSAVQRRRVRSWGLPDGMAALRVTSTAPDITAIRDCLSALGRAAKTPGDGRISDQREVDALVDICTDVLDVGSFRGRALPQTQRRRPHVQVTMPLDALLGGNSPAVLAGYGPITAGQARQIAGDGELRRLVCDPLSGTLLDYGRTTYRPPKALADHVIARDITCSAPGCRRPAEYCELDHTVPYPKGTTSAKNLSARCKHHHRAKDGGGHVVTRFPDGTQSWTTPLGTNVLSSPPRLWHPPSRSSDERQREDPPRGSSDEGQRERPPDPPPEPRTDSPDPPF